MSIKSLKGGGEGSFSRSVCTDSHRGKHNLRKRIA